MPGDAVDAFRDLPRLETERLALRPLRLADAGDVFAYASDPEVARYTSWEPHRSIEESRAFLRQVLAAYAVGRTGTWGIVDRASGRVVGTVTLFNVDQG
ncbi:MAG: GNAT family N-acetyltransferase, partial [Thermomicrobiaceae bacterium]|nr:GNAT family N-acetyltransferase [Thermomicrobiaceae bacterium]